jgi:AraC-like DNA-binding protein
MNRFNNISNTHLTAIIDEWIKNERDRNLMKRRLIDGISLERLAEEFELSPKQAYRITNKYYDYLYGLCTEWATISL